MAFTVRFAGLICHLNDERGRTAVFVNAHQHRLRMVIDSGDLIRATLPHDKVHTNITEFELGDIAYDVTGETLSFTGVTPNGIAAAASFGTLVPSLKDLSKGASLRTEVQQRAPFRPVSAYLNYPDSQQSVEDFFPNQASFPGAAPACMPRFTRLLLEAPSDQSVKIAGQNGYVELKSSATIAFVNAIEGLVPGQPNEHFHHYFMLVSNPPDPLLRPSDVTATCPQATKDPAAGLAIAKKLPGSDCTQSHYP